MILDGEEIFIIDIPNKEEKILYAPLRSYLAKVSSNIMEILEESNERELFLKRIKKNNLVDINKIHNHYCNRIPYLSIPVTDDCTLRCQYCYFRAGDNDKRTIMKKDNIKKYVDAYFSQLSNYKIQDENINVSIAGGGEPTKAFEEFKYTVEYIKLKAKEYGKKVRFTMPTNGFYGEEVRKFIVDNFWQVSLSMDGPEDIQNYQRPNPSLSLIHI